MTEAFRRAVLRLFVRLERFDEEQAAGMDGPPAIVRAPRLAPSEAARGWAALLQQLFEVDPLACPTCHSAMRIVAFITQASVIGHPTLTAARTARTAPVRDAGHTAARPRRWRGKGSRRTFDE